MKQQQNENWQQNAQESIEQLHTNASCGLSRKEARSRYRAFGANTLFDAGQSKKKHPLRMLLTDPTILLFIFVAVLALFFSEVAQGMSSLVCLICGCGFFIRTAHVEARLLADLQKTRIPRVWVSRDGKRHLLSARHVVPGDVIELFAGDIVPADCQLLSATDLLVRSFERDEKKRIRWKLHQVTDLLYGGSEIVRGNAVAVVHATGKHTRLGREWGSDLPAEYHAKDNGGAFVTVSPFLRLLSFARFLLFFVLVTVGLFTSLDNIGLLSLFLSMSAFLCVGSHAVLQLHFRACDVRMRDRFLRKEAVQDRAVLKSAQTINLAGRVTDLFVLGDRLLPAEAHQASRDGEESTKHTHLLTLLDAYQRLGVCVSFFLSSTSEMQEILSEAGPSSQDALRFHEYQTSMKKVENIGKYRVFLDFPMETIRELTVLLTQQGHRVATIGSDVTHLPILQSSTLAVGALSPSELCLTEQEEKNHRSEVLSSESSVRRHADLLLCESKKIRGGIFTFFEILTEARAFNSRTCAIFKFLFSSQLLTIAITFFSVVLGLQPLTAPELVYSSFLTETVGIIWLSSLVPATAAKLRTVTEERLLRILTDKTTWCTMLSTGLSTVAIWLLLEKSTLVPSQSLTSYLTVALILAQSVAFVSSAISYRLLSSPMQVLLPLFVIFLPTVILVSFSVALPRFHQITHVGVWNLPLLLSVFLIPTVFFLFFFVFSRIFHRTAK